MKSKYNDFFERKLEKIVSKFAYDEQVLTINTYVPKLPCTVLYNNLGTGNIERICINF
jgi:hypothetical protein